jgi:hypothetical protein
VDPVLLADVMDRSDVGMIQLCESQRLSAETPPYILVGEQGN